MKRHLKTLAMVMTCMTMVLCVSCKKDDDNKPGDGGNLEFDGVVNGHTYIDLGLLSGTLWATCNVGADEPEDYGNYYAWGETAYKNYYFWSTYKWTSSPKASFIKYYTGDNKTVLDPEDDAAHVNWGGGWRMPTRAEIEELINCCTWTWTTQNGKNGCLVTASNGKYIFLPAGGWYDKKYLNHVGDFGYYWSSSLNTNDIYEADELYFYYRTVYQSNSNRFLGYLVRPVCSSQN